METVKAQRLRGAREAQGKSLRRLESETGIARGTLSKIETGKLRPNIPQLLAIARALGLRDVVAVLERFVDDSIEPKDDPVEVST